MGIFDKIKNIFFEEEYVEVEEPSNKKVVKQEKVTVAKKLDLPEIKKEKVIEEEEPKEEVIEPVVEEEPKEEEPKFKFPMVFEEDDFKEEPFVEKYQEPEEEKVVEKKVEEVREVRYHYNDNTVQPYEPREERKEKPVFRPTPIISPIYGILDKNYRKEEIVTKKPVVLSTGSNRKVDFDSVRQKAYGDLASDITSSMFDDKEKGKNNEEEINTKDNSVVDEEDTFYDLNVNSPAVNRVTVGDAEEYFNDLGLEYNVDYKDASTDKKVGKKSLKDEEKEETKEEETSDVATDNNLFDLLESMYEDKEEE